MKHLLVILALFLLISCDDTGTTCWLCSVEKGKEVNVWNDWYQRYDKKVVWTYAGIEKFCDKKPTNKYHKVKYDCELL